MRYQVGDQPIPGYKLEAFLGAGSYGEVWRAGGPGGVSCALKFISMDSKSGLKEFRAIRLVKRLQHPNLCPVQAIWLRDPDGNVLSDSGEDSISIRLLGPKELVIAMGLGQKSLAQRLEEVRAKGGIPARELLKYADGAAKGIDYLNSTEHDLGDGPAGVIHCDIKPANLLVVGGGVQVCDYGVAKAMRKAEDAKKSMAAGTPAYAAPELINNDPCPQTDQYSLAITYYELRTGRLPFDEAKAIVANLMGQLDFSGVGPDEQAVLRQATHKQPGKRFESCEEFVEALKIAANVTFGPSGVISAGQTRRDPAPPPEVPPPARPAPTPVAKTLSDLLQPGGELVPEHFLTKLLGRGGYGEVWEARASGGVRCALKVVRDLQGRGKQEFAVLDTISKLDHPCLVQLRGYWLLASNGTRVQAHQVGLAGVPAPSAVVISTDLAEKNLLDRLKECKQDGLTGIPPDELVGHVRQAAVALDYLNIKHHIQHRDVKPENLLLRGDRLLVSDFGLAKLVEGDGDAVQTSSSGMTLEYAAPELLQKRVSSRTDQYSLALTYYTLRAGRMPFPPGIGQFDMMQARIKGQLDLSGVPEAERAVLGKALAPNPTDRFATCEELARQLAHASGVGTGPVPTLLSGGPDLSRITPADLAPRTTPPADFAKATPKHPLDTPRASARSSDVPLTPAEASGTVMFGDLPLNVPGPSGPRTTPAPWADEAPVKGTKSGKAVPKWTGDRPTEDGGRTAAAVVGVAVLAALIGVGVYHFIIKNSDRTVPTGPGVDVTQIVSDAERLIERGQFDDARRTIDQLDPIDKDRAKPLRDRLAAAVKRTRVTDTTARIEQRLAEKKLTEARDLLAELGALDPAAATAIRPRFDKAWKDRVAELDGLIRELDRAKKEANRSRFQVWYDELAALDPDKAAEARKWWDTNPMREVKPQPDGRVAVARGHFKTGKLADGLAVLEDVLNTSKDDAARRAAGSLKTGWAKAHAAREVKGAGYPAVAKYRELFPIKAADLPDTADRDDLTAFRKHDLAERIKAAVPGLDGKTDWKGLADACREAEQTPWVQACQTECWVELTLGKQSPEFPAPFVAGTDTDGYGGYANMVRRLEAALAKKDPRSAADDTLDLVDVELVAKHDWATAYRFGRLAGLLADARLPYRDPDDAPVDRFAMPYQQRQAGWVSRWLVAARKAAAKAGTGVEGGEIDYELTLAEGCKAEPDSKEFARAAAAVAAGEYLKKQDPLAQARFWVFHAKAQTSQAAELASLRTAFDLLKNPSTAREAKYGYDAVILKLQDDAIREVGQDKDKERPEVDLLADVAREVYKNRQVWGKWKVPEDKAPAQLAVELLLLAHEAKVKARNAKKALEYAGEAVKLARDRSELSAALRAEAYGSLGILQYRDGTTENKYKTWPDARANLEAALRLLADERNARGLAGGERPDEWKWRYALGGILAQTAPYEKDNAKAADQGTRAGWLMMSNYIEVYNLSEKAADPDDRALATHFFNSKSQRWFEAARDCCRLGVRNLPKDARLPAWRLTAAELNYALLKPEQRTAEEKENLAVAVKEAREHLNDLPEETRSEVEKQIVRLKPYLPSKDR